MKGVVNRFSFEGDVNRPTFCCHKNYQILAMQQSIAVSAYSHCLGNDLRQHRSAMIALDLRGEKSSALRREILLAEKFHKFSPIVGERDCDLPPAPKISTEEIWLTFTSSGISSTAKST